MTKTKNYSFAFMSKPISKMSDVEGAHALNEIQKTASSIKSTIRNNPELLAALGSLLGKEAQAAFKGRAAPQERETEEIGTETYPRKPSLFD